MTTSLDRLGLSGREQRAWALYDVANSAWMTTVMTAVFPPFFVGARDHGRPRRARRRARASRSRAPISVILVGLTGPVMGADRRPAREQEALPRRVHRDRRRLGRGALLRHVRALGARPRGLRGRQRRGHLEPRLLQRAAAGGRAAPRDRPRLDGRLRARLPGRRPAARRQPGDDLGAGALRDPRRRHRGAAVLRERGRLVGALLDPAAPPRAGARGPRRAGRGRLARAAARGARAARRDVPRAAPPQGRGPAAARLPGLQRRRQHHHPDGRDLRRRDRHPAAQHDGDAGGDPARGRAVRVRLRPAGRPHRRQARDPDRARRLLRHLDLRLRAPDRHAVPRAGLPGRDRAGRRRRRSRARSSPA